MLTPPADLPESLLRDAFGLESLGGVGAVVAAQQPLRANVTHAAKLAAAIRRIV